MFFLFDSNIDPNGDHEFDDDPLHCNDEDDDEDSNDNEDNDDDDDEDGDDNEDTTRERSWFLVWCIARGHPGVTCYTLIYSLTHSPL